MAPCRNLIILYCVVMNRNNRSADASSCRLLLVRMILALSMIAIITTFCGCERSSAVVIDFPDTELESAIRRVIEKPTGDITDTDLIGLTHLSANDRGISNLEGIQYCVDLTNLVLPRNEIANISLLSDLTELMVLDSASRQLSLIELNDNVIVDIGSLASLIHLTVLELGGNQIPDISALAALTGLKTLRLYDNQIVDVGAITNLTALTVLTLDGNQISDIDPLSELTRLTGLVLTDNQIIDISALSHCRNLTRLYLGGNQIVNTEVLSGLRNLTWLYLDRNRISDIGSLSNLANLTWLYLDANEIIDIRRTRSLTSAQFQG